MIKFVKNLLLFIAPMLIIAMIALLVERRIYLSSLADVSATMILIGDSHAQNGVDPSQVPGLMNCARHATTSPIWGLKLQDVLDANPQVRTVFVELCPLEIIRYANEPRSMRAAMTRNYVPEAFLLELLHSDMIGGFPVDRFGHDYVHGIVLPFLRRLVSWDFSSTLNAGFMPLDRSLEKSQWWASGKKVVAAEFEVPEDANTCVHRELVDMLTSVQIRGTKIVLITCPEWKWYRELYFDAKQICFFESEMKGLARQFNCQWINCLDDLENVENWADTGHLNRMGAERFSKILNEKLTQGSPQSKK